jgi:hypothetical protein
MSKKKSKKKAAKKIVVPFVLSPSKKFRLLRNWPSIRESDHAPSNKKRPPRCTPESGRLISHQLFLPGASWLSSAPSLPARRSALRKSTTISGWLALWIMIWDISISILESWNRSTTRSARGCHPCRRYILLPMSPERTMGKRWWAL